MNFKKESISKLIPRVVPLRANFLVSASDDSGESVTPGRILDLVYRVIEDTDDGLGIKIMHYKESSIRHQRNVRYGFEVYVFIHMVNPEHDEDITGNLVPLFIECRVSLLEGSVYERCALEITSRVHASKDDVEKHAWR